MEKIRKKNRCLVYPHIYVAMLRVSPKMEINCFVKEIVKKTKKKPENSSESASASG